MTLRQLQIFAEVAACGKMSTAAANLYVSQPTISETIAEIERYYDVKLFERYPKRLYLTAAGEVFLDETLKILEDYIHLDAVMQERLGGYPVRIAATAMAGHAVVIPALAHCMREDPGFKSVVQVHSTQTIQKMLAENECDVAITQGGLSEDGLCKVRVLKNRLVLVCHPDHPFASMEKVGPEDVSKQPFFLNKENSDSRTTILNYQRANGYDLNEVGTVGSMSVIKEAVLANLGIAVLPSTMVDAELAAGRLHGVPGYSWDRDFFLYYQRHKSLTDNMQLFVDGCQSLAAQETAGT